MGKLSNLVKLVDLLAHRRWVTLEAIQTICQIPERTAYRYLNTISEADIPVYYDRNRRAYSLNREQSWLAVGGNPEDSLIIAAALRLLSTSAGEPYRQEIERILGNICLRQPCPIEEILAMFDEQLRNPEEGTDRSQLLTAMLIHLAIAGERRVELTVLTECKEERVVSFERPRLVFCQRWLLVDVGLSGEFDPASGVALDQIKKVSIR